MKSTTEYLDAYSLYLSASKNAEAAIETSINWCSVSSVFTDEHIELFERKTNPTDEEIDFMVAYHLHPYHVDFPQAAGWADKRNQPINRGDALTYHVLCNMMRAYLGVDRHDDAIRIYELNEQQVSTDIRTLKASQEHLFLYVSAAYAGKGELDRSLEYLKRELSITEIHKSWLHSDTPMTIEELIKNGDMLYSLFALVFLLDEFEQFENTGRYQEIEQLVERNVSRYKHLPVFNRE